MGTNFYLEQQPPCECCGRGYPELHIGKSSAGWCFSLHIHPTQNIHTLGDWEKAWANGIIRNEYGEVISPERMRSIITERVWHGEGDLRRHELNDNHCVGHGPGTYDYIIGDFS